MSETDASVFGCDSVWISWYHHRRTSSLCSRWGVRLEVYDYSGRRLRRVSQIWQTVLRLAKCDERVIIVQNPSLGLAIIAAVIRRMRRFLLVVDAHNEGVRPFIRRDPLTRRVNRWLLKSADVTIVTNDELASDVQAAGGTPVVLPDPLPVLRRDKTELPAGWPKRSAVAFVVATYAPDEPIREVLNAASILEGQVDFVVSGRPPAEVVAWSSQNCPNVRFPGFLSDAQYVGAMKSASCVVDLSAMPDCLVCGAYEAIALDAPLVLSDNAAGRRLFGPGTTFVENSTEAIAKGIREAIASAKGAELTRGARRERYAEAWEVMNQDAVAAIQARSGPRAARASR